jgi:NADPH:quinone reductase-like Zn-dependent oxidoreductase
MKLYRIEAKNGIDDLRMTQADEPQPRAREILVRVRACSLNYRDLMAVKGFYPAVKPGALVPLSDGAGEVVAVGEGVTRFAVGDRVVGCFFDRWQGGHLTSALERTARGGFYDGTLAEYVAMSEEGVVHAPEHLSWEEAATLPCAAVTAWNALTVFGQLRPGETVLTQGTGGVSIFAIQLAKAAGARVIATSSSDEKLERARGLDGGLGADEVINYKRTPDWEREVKALTGRTGVDLVVEVGGPGTFARSMQATRTGGRIAVIGLLSGPGETIDPLQMLLRRLKVEGILVGSTEMFEAMNRAIVAHRIKPVIDRVFPFTEATAAYRHMESAGHFGKIVISVP